MGRSEENAGFVCEHCGRAVRPATNGSYRNHCPYCLYSKHVDVGLGDRAADCGGLMTPVALRRSRKGFQIVHRCVRCGVVRVNKAAERTQQPDDIDAMIALMQHGMRAN
ncbi:MAG: RNHCP domain-containing protein [Planctomycetes bacterium]|nr:RNHCP domain-containing protein [Planctomycetota bacterium]